MSWLDESETPSRAEEPTVADEIPKAIANE